MSEYLNNIVYGVKSFLTGMKLTMNHFRNKKELVATLQYPHEKWPIPERNIGFNHSEYNLIRSRLHVDIDDCIEQSMELANRIKNGGSRDHPVLLERWQKIE